MKRLYKCSSCGGPVKNNVSRTMVTLPVRDEQGQPREQISKKTGKATPMTYQKEVRGLGTWHCLNRCPDTKLQKGEPNNA